MGKKPRYLNYLKEVKPIEEYLKDTSKSEKTINTYLLALDKFFPFLVNRFKSEIKEIEDFDYETYFRFDDKPDDRKPDDTKSYKIDIKKKWEKLGIADKIITEYWLPLNANTKSNLLMKWSNVGSELDTFVRKERNKKELKDAKNTYLNYVWRIQGFLTRLGFEYKANPREMSKITTNGFHLSEEITYEDVIKLYEELDKTKYKLILKIIMYCGFNPADIVLLRPTDFERYKDTKLFVLVRKRKKTANKDTQYLVIFHEKFINELKDYFKRAHNQEWSKNNKQIIFNIASNTISDTFKYHRDKADLNPLLLPSSIRRLCFTRIKELFTLAEEDIYNLWTQHKACLLTRHYITDIMERFIRKNYIELIQRKVLIGNIKQYIAEINGYKEGMKRVSELEDIIKSMSKIILSLDQSFREELFHKDSSEKLTEEEMKEYNEIIEEGKQIGFSYEDMKLFREKVKEFLK